MCVKKQDFYIKRQLSYKNIICKKPAFWHKKAAFLQKYISVKKQFFYNRSICKKAGFLHKKAAFLQKIYFRKKAVFLQLYFCKKAVFFTTVQFVKTQLF